MALNVGQMVSELRRMTVTELRRKYAEVFGEQTRSHHKDYLIRRIAWRVQANAEGGLPERARQRALEIADDADLRMINVVEFLAAHAAGFLQAYQPERHIDRSCDLSCHPFRR